MKGVRIWLVGSTLAALFATAALVVVQVSRSSPPPAASVVPPPTPLPSVAVVDPVPPPVVTPLRSRNDIHESATSGDRAKAVAAKNALKARVAGGEGSDIDRLMLRALCRQLGDMSCLN